MIFRRIEAHSEYKFSLHRKMRLTFIVLLITLTK